MSFLKNDLRPVLHGAAGTVLAAVVLAVAAAVVAFVKSFRDVALGILLYRLPLFVPVILAALALGLLYALWKRLRACRHENERLLSELTTKRSRVKRPRLVRRRGDWDVRP